MQIDDINWIEQGDPQDQETLNRPTKELQEKLKTGDGVIQNDTTGNAQTQTTFESTRKINDTSFDGSEDITTEKWGEQRNIQVDLSKTSQTEVNGSEDVLNVGVDGILGLAQGGTGQGTQAQARTNLGLGNSQVLNTGTGTSNVLLGQNSQHQFQFSGSCLDFVVGNSTTTGRVRITLPWKTNSGKMVQFKIHIFQGYRQIEEYTVSGYLFQSDNNWHQPQQFHTHAQGTQPDIVFGRDNSGFAYVSVGVGQHQGVKVDSLVIGYTGTLQDHMNKGWSAVFNTSTPNQVQSINAVNIHSQNYTVYTYTKQQVDSKVQQGLPVGTVVAYAQNGTPSGWLLCNGGTYARQNYGDLYQAIGTIYGGNSTNFKIPDLRGRFIRGLGGNSAGLGASQGDAIRNITGNTNWGESSNHSNRPTGAFNWFGNNDRRGNGRADIDNMNIDFNASRVVPTANENRPVNMAMNYMIKY